MNISGKTVEKAFKKLKSSVYFDKTQVILRNAIVEFEDRHKNMDEYLFSVYEQLSDAKKFVRLQKNILNSISVLSFPKKLDDSNRDIIMNSSSKENRIKELQHFINMKVEGHLLGVLWIMLLGYKINDKIYEHSYGNRIRKKLINELGDNPTYSPYLFEPYFEQYESWRDKAMSEAKKHMAMKQDVIIITMDFRRYYYSIDADKEVFDSLYEEAIANEEGEYNEEQEEILKRLNTFVYKVVKRYSELFGDEYKKRCILPIGFLPSNIIGNWCLRNFDKAIVDGWNPVYYGRYVDDVLIVDKVEHNSDIYCKAKEDELRRGDVIEFFLKKCSKWNGVSVFGCDREKEFALIGIDEEETRNACEEAKNKGRGYKKSDLVVYHVNPRYNVVANNKSNIIVHNDKVKIFYFKSSESDALLTCFQANIAKNKSEFRHLPEDESVFQKDDYSEIYSLKNSDTINKLRGVDGIELNRFELSKFLGKYLRIGGMIKDKIESRFEKDILKIFNLRAILENYISWEKVIEIFVINERFRTVEHFVEQIVAAIESIQCVSEAPFASEQVVKKTLYQYLHSVLCRSFALVWKEERRESEKRIYSGEFLDRISVKCDNAGNCVEYLDDLHFMYCQTCMVDKSVMPISIRMLPMKKYRSGKLQGNLTNFNDVLLAVEFDWKDNYKYYPYMVNMYDFSMITCVEQLKENEPFKNMQKINQKQNEHYLKSNYNLEKDVDGERIKNLKRLVDVKELGKEFANACFVTVGDGNKSRLKVAIANVKLDSKNFQSLVKGMPNRSYTRYRALSSLVNQAIDQKADMLIMPEAFVPYEWLSTLARTCARNNMAVVTGVEHIKVENKIFNLTAIILPYLEEGHRCAHLSFHLKTHYAPSEKEKINGYRLTEMEGKHYELYKWNNCYFPVYCCYELTSIFDRGLFQAYADMIIAVEWNKDINYYSNILESLSRDVHCYCIQVNTSDYGDSRITRPSKTEEKDVIKTKGGSNSTILIEDIDIAALREFQLKEYTLQKNGTFKVTPPGFNTDIIMKKVKEENLFGDTLIKNTF